MTPIPAPSSPHPYHPQIYISGFPQGVRARELHNLVRFIPGYAASQV